MPQVFVDLKGPVDPTNYEKQQVDKLTVYVKNDLILEDEIRVRYPEVASDLSGRELEVVGATPPAQ